MNGTIQALRHTAKDEAANAAASAAKIAPLLAGKVGLRRRDQRANLEAVARSGEALIAAGEAIVDAAEEALEVLAKRKAEAKAKKGK